MAGYTGRNILIVVDNSADSEQAVEWAAVNLYKPGDEFHLVHIIKDETEKLREYYQEKSLEAAANKYIQERFVPKLVAAGIVVVVDIVRRPDDEAPQGAAIVKKADEVDAATIVLCPHEQDFKEGNFLNSVAKWVVMNSQRVVTVLHPYRLGHKKPYATNETHPAHA
ncbi:g10737 [Coccomyxa viridis]|uniref:G10737 protein n=1 Tax=Coccomyxa viridis TaxID=1274662 RepID=A0ABP1GAX4_9CHLO